MPVRSPRREVRTHAAALVLIGHSDAGLTSRVRLSYDRTLDRSPDPAGLRYWKSYYGRSGRLARMLSAQMASSEAWAIAQQDGVSAERGDRLFL